MVSASWFSVPVAGQRQANLFYVYNKVNSRQSVHGTTHGVQWIEPTGSDSTPHFVEQ